MRWTPLVLAAGLAACSGDPAPDAGTDDATAPADGASAPLCARDADCEDGRFCTVHACRPGEDGADARGCVPDGDPCEGMACREEDRACAPIGCDGDLDLDGDGHERRSCGGDDCDDFDPNRFEGNGEVCDAAGRDEDCDPTTLGDTDDDGDGFVSAACCNGPDCGPDCDDSAADVSPSSREACNGRDDDCDGAVDEEDGDPLCPGGTCVGGRCDLRGWDRTYGGRDFDFALSVVMDHRGHVYVTGNFSGTPTFGGESASSDDTGAFIASWRADGAFRWLRAFDSVNGDYGIALAFDESADQLYASIVFGAAGAVGHGVEVSGPGSMVLALRPDGEIAWQLEMGDRVGPFALLGAAAGRLAVGASLDMPRDLGCGTVVTPAGDRDAFVAWLDADGRCVRVRHFPGQPGSSSGVHAVDLADDGSVVVVGGSTGAGVDLGLGVRSNATPTSQNLFVVSLSPDGTTLADYWVESAGRVFSRAIAAGPNGVYVGGDIDEPTDFGRGTAEGASGPGAFVVRLTDALEFRDSRVWSWGGGDGLSSLALTSDGTVAAVGGFTGDVDFGAGRRSTVDQAGFVATFEPDLRPRDDRMIRATVCPDTTCSASVSDIAIGPADSTAVVGVFVTAIDLGSGTRSSAGAIDGFVARLAN